MSDIDVEHELAQRALKTAVQLDQQRSDLALMLESPAGRRVLARLVFEFGGLQALAYASDPRQHALNEGQRTVGAVLERELYEASRDGWAQLHAERIEKLRQVPVDKKPFKTDQ